MTFLASVRGGVAIGAEMRAFFCRGVVGGGGTPEARAASQWLR
jgi:hypothetical protein